MRAAVVAASFALAGCTGVADLSEARRPLSADESVAVRKKADEALSERDWKDAWEQEAQAGGDRTRLEAIFLASLTADAGPYEAMHAQLVKRFSALSPEVAARVAGLANQAEGKGDWKRAADVLLLVAEDAPAYRSAWDLYARAPVKSAPDVLHRIQDARTAWDEARQAPPK